MKKCDTAGVNFLIYFLKGFQIWNFNGNLNLTVGQIVSPNSTFSHFYLEQSERSERSENDTATCRVVWLYKWPCHFRLFGQVCIQNTFSTIFRDCNLQNLDCSIFVIRTFFILFFGQKLVKLTEKEALKNVPIVYWDLLQHKIEQLCDDLFLLRGHPIDSNQWESPISVNTIDVVQISKRIEVECPLFMN